MLAVHTDFVVDRKDNLKAVLIPYAEWKNLMEDIDELEDIRAYDRAKARKDEAIPFEQAVRALKQNGK